MVCVLHNFVELLICHICFYLFIRNFFCINYGEQGQECIWCHRPTPSRFYTSTHYTACTACTPKHQQKEQRGKGIQQDALDENLIVHSYTPNEESANDVQLFLHDQEEPLIRVIALVTTPTIFIVFIY